jgi:hypothetical protein
MVVGYNMLFYYKCRFHILHFPNSTRVFTKPTGRHYTKYRFSPDIELPIILEEIMEYTSNEQSKTGRCQHVTCWI